MVLPEEPEVICLLLGEKQTVQIAWVCLLNGPATTFPVMASHTRTVLSFEPEAICLLLGEKAT